MQVSFLIRTLNEADDLPKTLDLINNQNGNHDIEVLIVDSGSTDTTLDIAEKNNCKILLMKQEEWSWGRSLNYGFENASYEYVVIISAHCFLSSYDFINNLEILIEKNLDVAAFYGQQLPLDYYDPFEEYELFKWYPSKEILMHKKTQLTGVSNACSIVKKSIWIDNKYNEIVDSLEDSIWAHNLIKKDFKLLYSNSISVFHSHKFNPEYIYRKWYWRTFESNKFMDEYMNPSRFKNVIKYLIYRPYIVAKSLIEILDMYKYLNKKYNFISIHEIVYFMRIKILSVTNAFYDYKNHYSDSSYWKLLIPKKVSIFVKKFAKLKKHLELGLNKK